MTMYEKYCQLKIDSRWIGLEKSDLYVDYFCTPINATVIGWENSIHYCFIKGYRDMVFTVNPEPTVDKYVYPLAMNFKDFLRVILACGSSLGTKSYEKVASEFEVQLNKLGEEGWELVQRVDGLFFFKREIIVE